MMEWRLEWSPADLQSLHPLCLFKLVMTVSARPRPMLVRATSHHSSRCILMPAARPLCSNSVRLKRATTSSVRLSIFLPYPKPWDAPVNLFIPRSTTLGHEGHRLPVDAPERARSNPVVLFSRRACT